MQHLKWKVLLIGRGKYNLHIIGLNPVLKRNPFTKPYAKMKYIYSLVFRNIITLVAKHQRNKLHEISLLTNFIAKLCGTSLDWTKFKVSLI